MLCSVEFLEKAPEGSINEMRPSVTYYHPRCAKPWNDNIIEHFMGVLSISSPARQGFYPFGHVIHGDQDILAIMGLWKRSHIIDTPDVKEFHLKIIC